MKFNVWFKDTCHSVLAEIEETVGSTFGCDKLQSFIDCFNAGLKSRIPSYENDEFLWQAGQRYITMAVDLVMVDWNLSVMLGFPSAENYLGDPEVADWLSGYPDKPDPKPDDWSDFAWFLHEKAYGRV